ncbi:MAG: rubrerythrin family protein [Desulfarculales bacterium]|jgi:rubrerythrin|nr:rubrerythrin family protein [Desulfarculales bacterium]
MSRIKGTKTENNLLAAFAGESQARNRYSFFARQAEKDGFRQAAFVFTETADQEKEHAKRLFKILEGGEIEITASFPAGIIGDTQANLRESAAGEHHETVVMYPEFAKIAREEGFNDIAAIFSNIAIAEAFHEKRFLALADNIKNATVFKKPSPVAWRCRNCGWTFEGTEAPAQCPACAHPRDYFEIRAENW